MNLGGVSLKNFYELCGDPKETGKISNFRVSIPLYQRPYKWGEIACNEKEDSLITKLIEDFKENNNSKYFAGTILSVDNSVDKDFIDLIDGQQRVTTIFLINYINFLLLRIYVRKLINEKMMVTVIKKLEGLDKSLKNIFTDESCSINELIEFITSKEGEIDQEEVRDAVGVSIRMWT